MDSTLERICHSEIFRDIPEERVRELIEKWYDSGHWWEPDEMDLILFLEGEL